MTPWLRAMAAGLAVAVAMAAAPAAARPDSRTMTCEQARALVRARGAVVLGTGRYTYERVVDHAGYCDRGETAELFIAPTRDVANCRVGGYCRSRAPISR